MHRYAIQLSGRASHHCSFRSSLHLLYFSLFALLCVFTNRDTWENENWTWVKNRIGMSDCIQMLRKTTSLWYCSQYTSKVPLSTKTTIVYALIQMYPWQREISIRVNNMTIISKGLAGSNYNTLIFFLLTKCMNENFNMPVIDWLLGNDSLLIWTCLQLLFPLTSHKCIIQSSIWALANYPKLFSVYTTWTLTWMIFKSPSPSLASLVQSTVIGVFVNFVESRTLHTPSSLVSVPSSSITRTSIDRGRLNPLNVLSSKRNPAPGNTVLVGTLFVTEKLSDWRLPNSRRVVISSLLGGAWSLPVLFTQTRVLIEMPWTAVATANARRTLKTNFIFVRWILWKIEEDLIWFLNLAMPKYNPRNESSP